jgi:IS5 family transposase
MMGKRQAASPKLFYTQLNLADRVSARNPLRAVAAAIDFGWIRPEVGDLYGYNGHESVDPVVILKLHFLLFFENVSSARLLMERLPERLDWLWFCGYDLDSELPDHSVLSKARSRWGRETFVRFFRRVLEQCVAEGLVDGRVLHVDGSLISANASVDSLGPRLQLLGGELFDRLEQEEGSTSQTSVSSTDPDARLRRKNGKLQLGYQEVRAVDDQHGIITASVTVDAGTEEAHQILPALQQHEDHVGSPAQTVVADKKFGTGENYRQLQQQGIHPCIPHATRTPRKGWIPQGAFTYKTKENCYVCPRGQELHFSFHCPSKRADVYSARGKACADCPLRERCAGKRAVRNLWRHQDQEAIEWADGHWSREHRRRLMRRRMHVMEGSFADASNHHGYKRARWRGLVSVTVQNLLIAAIQNVRKLLRYARKPRAALVQGMMELKSCVFGSVLGGSLCPASVRRLRGHLRRLHNFPWSQHSLIRC